MARIETPIVYAIDGSDIIVQPATYAAQRDPDTSDSGPYGATWLNTSTEELFVMVDIDNNTWASDGSAGSGSFTSVTVNPGNLDVTAGDTTLGGALTIAGLTTFNGDATVASGSTLTINGDLDLSSGDLIDLTSTLDADPAIYLHANGGTSEVIRLRADQGTAVDSLDFVSDVGGITATAGLASDDAINLVASNGGIDMDAALTIDIATSQAVDNALILTSSAGGMWLNAAGGAGLDLDVTNVAGSINIDAGESAADAIVMEASGAAGAVQIKAGTGGILIGNEADTTTIDLGDFAATASRTITLAGGQQVTAATTDLVDIAPDGVATNADSVKQVDICSGNVSTGQSLVNINTGTAASGTSTVNISTNTGGGTKTVNVGNADALTTFNVDAITLINDSINANVSIATGTSTGAVSIGNAAAGAIALDSGAAISLDGAAASNFSVAGAGIDLTLDSAAGRVVLDGGEAAADAIRLNASDAAGGIDIDFGSGGLTLDGTSGGYALTADAASSVGVTGAGIDLTVDSAAGRVVVDGGEAAADAVRITASDAAGGIDIDAGTGGITIDSTDAVSIQGAAASDISVSGAGIDLSLVSAAGRVIVQGDEAAANAVTLTSSAGGLDADFADDIAFDNSAGNISLTSAAGNVALDAAGTLLVDAAGVLELNSSAGVISIGNDAVAQNINVGTGAAARTVTIGNTTGATAVDIDAGTGGINLSSGGIFTLDAVANTIASPTASTTINANIGAATWTGFTTASAATEQFTITNSVATATSQIICVAANEGANAARMTVTRINRSAGSFVVDVTNNGSAALNGNLTLTFIILN